jgi:two-component system response regulator YesN
MIKLLIVDDEPIEREGLKAILQHGIPDLAIELARNGKAALEMVPQLQPDLILMDIKMPGMSGLEAVERIRAMHPGIKFIMVTAYDTFEYARRAIKLGVKDYLLKPSKAAEIVETVGRVIREIEAERREREAGRQARDALTKMMPVVEADVVTQLLFDHVHDVHLNELLRLLGVETMREAFVLLVSVNAGPSADAFYLGLKEKIRELGCGWVGAMSGRQIPIVVFREAGKSYRAQASSIVQKLLALQNRWPGTECFIGIGSPCASPDHIRQSYQEALVASADPTLPARYRFYGDFPASARGRPSCPDKETEKRLLDHIRTGQWERVEEIVTEVIHHLEKTGTGLVEAQQRALEMLWIVYRALQEMGIEAEKPLFSFQVRDYRQLRAETKGLLGRLRHEVTELQRQLGPDVAGAIKRFIVEHCQEDISLETISRQVRLSPYYISKVFKEQTGVNYIDFLTECRVEKAKALMSDPNLSLKEIAIEVGYRDPNYFSKVFKKTCGISPTQYRKRLLGRQG